MITRRPTDLQCRIEVEVLTGAICESTAMFVARERLGLETVGVKPRYDQDRPRAYRSEHQTPLPAHFGLRASGDVAIPGGWSLNPRWNGSSAASSPTSRQGHPRHRGIAGNPDNVAVELISVVDTAEQDHAAVDHSQTSIPSITSVDQRAADEEDERLYHTA